MTIELEYALKAPDDVARLVVESTKLTMARVKCFCSNSYPHYISCLTEVGEHVAPFLARDLGGDMVGTTNVTFVLPVTKSFCCQERDEDLKVRRGTCVCNRGHSQPNPKQSN